VVNLEQEPELIEVGEDDDDDRGKKARVDPKLTKLAQGCHLLIKGKYSLGKCHETVQMSDLTYSIQAL